ncbi:MAG: carboxypeptidase-like regulatory domain-containing protein [Planctomycetota bacterium]
MTSEASDAGATWDMQEKTDPSRCSRILEVPPGPATLQPRADGAPRLQIEVRAGEVIDVGTIELPEVVTLSGELVSRFQVPSSELQVQLPASCIIRMGTAGGRAPVRRESPIRETSSWVRRTHIPCDSRARRPHQAISRQAAPAAVWPASSTSWPPEFLQHQGLWREGEQLGDSLRVDSAGRFATKIAPGSVLVRVYCVRRINFRTEDDNWQEMLESEKEILRVAVEAPGHVSIPLDRAMGALAGKLQGISPDEAGLSLRLIPRTDLELFSGTQPSREQFGVPVIEGWFVSQAVPAGTYDVVVHVQEKRQGRAEWISNVTVSPGEVTDLGVHNFQAGRLRGRVLDESGGPVPQAVVSLKSTSSSTEQRTISSAADGTFLFEDPRRERYWIDAVAPDGKASEMAEICVASGSEVTIELHLGPRCRLTGHVTREGTRLTMSARCTSRCAWR